MSSARLVHYGVVDDILEERRVKSDFRWATKTWSPSPSFFRGGKRKDAREIIQIVLASDNVQNAIQEVCAREGKEAKDVQKEAQDILIEMGHDFHLYAVRWFGIVLSKLSKRLYSSIQVNTEKFAKIKQAFASYPVILLPTHRSYVDFLLVSYMFFHYNLPLPIIAAGMDFMGMVGIGEMLRRSGAFFIRRKFGGDQLYWALVSEYVKKCSLYGGHPVEMFVEGTRSRSGKSISPKTGLLSAMLEMVWKAEIPDILILPISMSYDRTLEEKLYAHELLGQPKPKESTNGLLKALRWLNSQSYGSIYVNFGDLISVREWFDRHKCSSSIPLRENGILSKCVQEIAIESVLEHQRNLVVPIFPVVSTIILAKISREQNKINFNELMRHVTGLKNILGSRQNQLGLPNTGDNLENNVRHILNVHSSLVTRDSQDQNELAVILESNEVVQFMQFQHYANQLLPLILPCCLVSVISQSHNSNSLLVNKNLAQNPIITTDAGSGDENHQEMNAQLSLEYTFVRHVLQEDFPYKVGSEQVEMTWAVNTLNSINKHLLDEQHSRNSFYSNSRTENLQFDSMDDLLQILKSAVEPYLISYWGVANTLLDAANKGPCEMKQFSKICQEFIHQQLKTNSLLPKQYGALSLDTINNAILASVQSLATTKVKLEDGAIGVIVKDSQQLFTTRNRLEKLLGLNCSNTSLNEARYSTEPKLQLRSKL